MGADKEMNKGSKSNLREICRRRVVLSTNYILH
jgi:hypothetical protein